MRLFLLSPSEGPLRKTGNPAAKSSEKKQVKNGWCWRGFDSVGEESISTRDVFVAEMPFPDFLRHLK